MSLGLLPINHLLSPLPPFPLHPHPSPSFGMAKEYIDIHDSLQCFMLNNALTSLSGACGKQEGNVNLTRTF